MIIIKLTATISITQSQAFYDFNFNWINFFNKKIANNLVK